MSVMFVDSMGGDLSIVNAARVSYNKLSYTMTEADRGLISYLAKHRHGTPFEMVQFKFRVHTPIGVAREWQRHRIGSFNEVSTRYVEVEPEFYIPDTIRSQIGKSGHYQMVTIDDTSTVELIREVMHQTYDQSYAGYRKLLELGVAKELARNVLPLGLYTEFIWSVNLRSLFNFLSLRTHETALLEIRKEAQIVENYIRDIVPVAWQAWNDVGRISL